MLEAPWWQGLAGIAQILAAILSVVAVIQAKRMLGQAEDARKESADPDWDVTGCLTGIGGPTLEAPEWCQTDITLLNTGFGPARMVEVEYIPGNGNQYRWLTGQGQLPNSRLVPPGDTFNIRFHWDMVAPLAGTLSLTCETRFGSLTRQFIVRTYLDEKQRGHCDVNPVTK